MLKAQCGLTAAVESIDLDCPIISAHQDVVHPIADDIIGVDAKNS